MEIKDEKKEKFNLGNVIFSLLIIFLVIVGVKFFLFNGRLLTFFLLFVCLLSLIKWASRETLVVFIICGVIFAVGEMVFSFFIDFEYEIINFTFTIISLFLIWGLTSAFTFQMIREIRNLIKSFLKKFSQNSK